MKLARGCVVALLGLWVVFCLSLGSAQANGVGSDRITVTGPGGLIADRTLSEGSEGLPGGLISIDTGIRPSNVPSFIHQFDLVEPDGSTFSDHVRAVFDAITSDSNIVIFFCSDENDVVCLTFTGPNVIETGELQDVSKALGVDDFGITVMVQSDLSDLVGTPEPGTLLMLAVGLAGLAGGTRIGRRQEK
jgi:hypothetical protein